MGVTKSTPKARKKSKSTTRTEIPLYLDAETSLPPGWNLEVKQRSSSRNVDRYWYTPHWKYKLRSRVQVKRYLDNYASLEEFKDLEDGSKEKEKAVWDKVFSKRKKVV